MVFFKVQWDFDSLRPPVLQACTTQQKHPRLTARTDKTSQTYSQDGHPTLRHIHTSRGNMKRQLCHSGSRFRVLGSHQCFCDSKGHPFSASSVSIREPCKLKKGNGVLIREKAFYFWDASDWRACRLLVEGFRV